MAPDLKRFVIKSILHQGDISIINHVMESKDGIRIHDPDIREMVDDLLESNSVRRENEKSRGEKGAVEGHERKYDKPHMTDEEYEGFAVWIKTDNVSENQDAEPSGPEHKEAKERFSEYSHHHYIKRWGRLAEEEGKNEEWYIPDPPVLTENDPDYLCDMCRHINFQALFAQRGLPGNDLPGPTKIRLHGVDRMLQRENCAFCRLISRKIKSDRLLDFEDTRAMKAADIRLNVLDAGPLNALRLEIELSDPSRLPESQRVIIQRVADDGIKPFHGIVVDQAKISTDVLQKWGTLCENAHPEMIDHCIDRKRSGLRLIDVHENLIVEIKGPCRYVCLSYVWGRINQPQYNSKTKDAFQAPNGLNSEILVFPRTIRDAMLVTKRLGINYIWIDALCIQQDDEQDKAAIIADMGAIYSNAIFTIVASTNSDPSAGLPGVSTTPRSKAQLRETVQGVQLAVAFHDDRKPLQDVEKSIWNSRAWTYQERQLSQRMLFFTESQMCFMCPHATLFEDTYPVTGVNFKPASVLQTAPFYRTPQEIMFKIWSDPTQYCFLNKAFETDGGLSVMVGEEREADSELKAPVYQCRQVSDSNTSGMRRIRGQNIWNVYRQAVNEYTCRNITSDSDAVSAFDGMAELIRKGTNTKFWLGIPAFAFDQALLWYPKEPLQRRKDQEGKDLFPSWTWASWKGPCYYRGRGWHNGLYRCPVSAVHWMQQLDPVQFLAKYGANLYTGLPEGLRNQQIQEEILSGKWKLLGQIDSRVLYHFDFEERGWQDKYDDERNQHGYTHEQYPGIVFNYPIPLPGQGIFEIPDCEGALRFQAYSNQVQFCDMRTTEHVSQAGHQQFLQIGLEDESRSATFRPPWQRIIYHQGYRAGFLMLNIPFEEIDTENQGELVLVAMSRDEIPRTAPPTESWDVYKALGPVEMVWNVGRKQQWMTEKLHQSIQGPDESVAPTTSPIAENGDAIWDEYRFQETVYALYNVLLLRKNGQAWERVGVGKMHYHAFHHAVPKMDTFLLK
jgi:hypothetical protein